MAIQTVFTGILLGLLLVLSTSQSLSTPDAESRSEVEVPKVPEAKKRLCPIGSAFHNETSSCHTLLDQGPCGDLQVFYVLWKDAEYGDCACISNSDGCNLKVRSHRMVLPSPDSKKCFWAYSEGPCQSGEWYVLNIKTMKPECQKNPCDTPSGMKKMDSVPVRKPSAEGDVFTFTKNDICYKTFTKGFCSEGQYVQFIGTNDPYPKCLRVKAGPPLCLFGVAPVVGMPCEPGYKQVGDDCVLANPEFE